MSVYSEAIAPFAREDDLFHFSPIRASLSHGTLLSHHHQKKDGGFRVVPITSDGLLPVWALLPFCAFIADKSIIAREKALEVLSGGEGASKPMIE